MEIQVIGTGKVMSGAEGRGCVFENQAGEHSKLNSKLKVSTDFGERC